MTCYTTVDETFSHDEEWPDDETNLLLEGAGEKRPLEGGP